MGYADEQDANDQPSANNDNQPSQQGDDDDQPRSSNQPNNKPSRRLTNPRGKSLLDDVEGEEEAQPPRTALEYGRQILCAIVIFVVGCTVACELTGISLWRGLERRT